MLNSLTASELVNTHGVIIDTRSEGEFLDAHVPGAANVPLLNNSERSEVGTLYKKSGAEPARHRGLEIVKPKLEELLQGIAKAASLPWEKIHKPSVAQLGQAFDLVSRQILGMTFEENDDDGTSRAEAPPRAGRLSSGGKSDTSVPDELDRSRPLLAPLVAQPQDVAAIPLIFYCWRGGARSKSMALLASALGFNSRYVVGGHKKFRNEVLSFLAQEKYPFKLCTLYGLTGSGKTLILRQWLREGKPVVDLEALAHHRGSAFGQVGIDELGRQKDFENNLYWEIQKLLMRGEKTIVVEGESRRIGRCNLSDQFMQAMAGGLHVKVNVSLEQRVQNIMKDYVAPLGDARLQKEAVGALDAIKKKLGGEKHAELLKILVEKNYAKFTEELLIHYYDKMYPLARAPDSFYQAEIAVAGDWARILSQFY